MLYYISPFSKVKGRLHYFRFLVYSTNLNLCNENHTIDCFKIYKQYEKGSSGNCVDIWQDKADTYKELELMGIAIITKTTIKKTICLCRMLSFWLVPVCQGSVPCLSFRLLSPPCRGSVRNPSFQKDSRQAGMTVTQQVGMTDRFSCRCYYIIHRNV
jgi:hypothetical protein